MFLRFEGAEDVRVRLPGVTTVEYGRVRDLAQAGLIHDPLVMRFVRAFADVVGRIDGQSVDLEDWSDAETIGFLRWLDFVPGDEWTALDDVELAHLAGGAS